MIYFGNTTTKRWHTCKVLKGRIPFWRHKGTKNTPHLLLKQYHFNICLYMKYTI